MSSAELPDVVVGGGKTYRVVKPAVVDADNWVRLITTEEPAGAYNTKDNPTASGVYSVMVNLSGVWHPRAHEPELFSYDGVDSWGSWEFSPGAASRVRCDQHIMRPWREVK